MAVLGSPGRQAEMAGLAEPAAPVALAPRLLSVLLSATSPPPLLCLLREDCPAQLAMVEQVATQATPAWLVVMVAKAAMVALPATVAP